MAKKKTKKKNLCSDGRLQKSFMFNGKRIYVRARDKDELEKKIYEKKLQLTEVKELHDNPTIEIFFKRWMDNRRGSVTQATLRSQQCHYVIRITCKYQGIFGIMLFLIKQKCCSFG